MEVIFAVMKQLKELQRNLIWGSGGIKTHVFRDTSGML